MTFLLVVAIVSLLSVVLVQRSHIVEARRRGRPCARCGEKGSTDVFRGSRSLPNFFPDELHLCFTCRDAHTEWLEHLFMLTTERQYSFGRGALIREAQAVWGDRAMDLVALLLVAERDIDLASRILTPASFEKVRPWIEERVALLSPRTEHDPPPDGGAPPARQEGRGGLGLTVGKTVEISAGVFAGHRGTVLDVDEPEGRVRLEILVFGRRTPLVLDRSDCRPVGRPVVANRLGGPPDVASGPGTVAL